MGTIKKTIKEKGISVMYFPGINQYETDISFDFEENEIHIRTFIKEELSTLVVIADIKKIYWDDLIKGGEKCQTKTDTPQKGN